MFQGLGSGIGWWSCSDTWVHVPCAVRAQRGRVSQRVLQGWVGTGAFDSFELSMLDLPFLPGSYRFPERGGFPQVIAVSRLANDLYPDKQKPVASVTKIATCIGFMNIIGMWFGSIPFCHGVSLLLSYTLLPSL